MTQNTGSTPAAPVDHARAVTKSLADLRQAVWEASQFRTTAAIREYVDLVIREIDSDAP
jgi:hypothetical protein